MSGEVLLRVVREEVLRIVVIDRRTQIGFGRAWGAYRPEGEVGRQYARPDGTRGALGPQKTVRESLTLDVLARHFRAAGRADIIGLHTAGPDNLSLGGALDIDHHGPTSAAPDVNLRAALHWHGEVVRRGFRPLLLDSNGAGGFHLRLLLAEPTPADRLFHFLRELTRDHQGLGLDRAPEQFPKQADVRRCKKGLGNWLRLPGRHHKRAFWSRVWDGGRWLEGDAAVDFILALEGDPPGLIPEPPPTRAARPAPRGARSAGRPDNLAARIAGYMARLPNLAEGQGRDDVAYGFACFLVRDLQLADEVALAWLENWDARNSPPKGAERLRTILADAHAYGQRAYGRGLGPASSGRDGRHRLDTISFTLEV